VNTRRAWLVLAAAGFAYMVAVLQRSTLGVAGTKAAAHFSASAAALSTLAVVQLVVYAAMQIPVGLLLDRFGSRLLILCGSALMAIGQITVALAPSLGIGIVGRMLVGAGDAAIFISLMRLVPSWFRGRIVPLLSQWIGNVGQLGQILSAIPFALLLHATTWRTAFLSAAAVSVIATAGVLLTVRNRAPDAPPTMVRQPLRASLVALRATLARPGTRLGFWSHYVTQSLGTVFSLLWGFPFLVSGLGYSTTTASLLLTLLVVSGACCGPVLGVLVARYPGRRSDVVLLLVAGMWTAWAVMLAWPGGPPFWVVVLTILVIGAGGPGSIIGFDFARTFNPPTRLGAANGVVNIGGFLASFVMMFLIGVVLDAVPGPGGAASGDGFSLHAFRIAFLVPYLVVGVGVVGVVRSRRQTRSRMAEEEGIRVAPVWVALMRRIRLRRMRTRG
jgi:MFS family permease